MSCVATSPDAVLLFGVDPVPGDYYIYGPCNIPFRRRGYLNNHSNGRHNRRLKCEWCKSILPLKALLPLSSRPLPSRRNETQEPQRRTRANGLQALGPIFPVVSQEIAGEGLSRSAHRQMQAWSEAAIDRIIRYVLSRASEAAFGHD